MNRLKITLPKSLGSRILFFLGLFLLVCGILVFFRVGFTVSVYGAYAVFVYSCFIYFAGALLIFIPLPKFKNAVLILLPVIIIYLTLYIDHYVHIVRVTYIVPHNYTKTFTVVYDKKGVRPKKINGRWILTIPDDGILITDTIISVADEVDQKYYMQNLDKSIKEINPESYCYQSSESIEPDDFSHAKRFGNLITEYHYYQLFSNDKNFPNIYAQEDLEILIAKKLNKLSKEN